ncbi:MAG TPA: hypothetical protein VGQ81_01355 [Acidobacteriota bacterium]|jgi:hypothetical protein|nr:hypothetical protein [Acidobacteriota bacterium]
MKKTLYLLVVVSVFLSIELATWAQDRSTPPKVLQIFREEVKPGRAAAHEKLEAGYPRAFAKAKWPTYYLAMTEITGPGEAWFLTGYDSFASVEKDQKAVEKNAAFKAELDQLDHQDGEFRTGQRSMFAIFREDLSYKANADVSQKRYLEVITFRMRPGHDADLGEAVKVVRAAYEQVYPDASWATYQVASGMPAGTYLVFVPFKSLDEIDAGQARAKALQGAEGEEGLKKLQKVSSEGFLSTETNIYALSPKMSYVSKDWAAADPEFWNPKPKLAPAPKLAATAAPAGKETAKPAAPKK